MKNILTVLKRALIIGFLLLPALTFAQKPTTDWDSFSKNIEKALSSDNIGLQKSAMQQIIRYGDYLDVKDAAFDIMDVYRYNKNDRVRHLAMVTIYKMDYKMGLDFIIRNLRFEDYEPIKDRIYAIMHEMEQNKSAKKIAEKYALLD